MQLRHVKTFVAVASTLNFTRAAERVHLAQSSVTEQIQALESDLGAKLFERSGRRLRLSEAGRQLLGYADELLALAGEAEAAVASAAGVVAGTLTIGGLETVCGIWLAPLLARFREDHPAVHLQLKVGRSGELRSGVRSGTMDVCLSFGEPPADPLLQGEVVGYDGLAIIVPIGHRLAGRRAIAAEEFEAEPFLVTETGCVYRRMFETIFPPTGRGRPQIAGEVNSIATILRLVEAGSGCALVPRAAIAGRDSGIVALPWLGNDASVPVSMICRRRRVQSPALRSFMALARQTLGSSDQPMSAVNM